MTDTLPYLVQLPTGLSVYSSGRVRCELSVSDAMRSARVRLPTTTLTDTLQFGGSAHNALVTVRRSLDERLSSGRTFAVPDNDSVTAPTTTVLVGKQYIQGRVLLVSSDSVWIQRQSVVGKVVTRLQRSEVVAMDLPVERASADLALTARVSSSEPLSGQLQFDLAAGSVRLQAEYVLRLVDLASGNRGGSGAPLVFASNVRVFNATDYTFPLRANTIHMVEDSSDVQRMAETLRAQALADEEAMASGADDSAVAAAASASVKSSSRRGHGNYEMAMAAPPSASQSESRSLGAVTSGSLNNTSTRNIAIVLPSLTTVLEAYSDVFCANVQAPQSVLNARVTLVNRSQQVPTSDVGETSVAQRVISFPLADNAWLRRAERISGVVTLQSASGETLPEASRALLDMWQPNALVQYLRFGPTSALTVRRDYVSKEVASAAGQTIYRYRLVIKHCGSGGGNSAANVLLQELLPGQVARTPGAVSVQLVATLPASAIKADSLDKALAEAQVLHTSEASRTRWTLSNSLVKLQLHEPLYTTDAPNASDSRSYADFALSVPPALDGTPSLTVVLYTVTVRQT